MTRSFSDIAGSALRSLRGAPPSVRALSLALLASALRRGDDERIEAILAGCRELEAQSL